MKIFKLIVLTIFLIYPLSILNADTVEEIIKERNVEVFKTPSCGCCYGYVLFLEEEKFEVKQTDMESLLSIKKKT